MTIKVVRPKPVEPPPEVHLILSLEEAKLLRKVITSSFTFPIKDRVYDQLTLALNEALE